MTIPNEWVQLKLTMIFSLERIEAYLNIDQEAKPTSQGVPPAYWPTSGALIVENLCARYTADGPEVFYIIEDCARPLMDNARSCITFPSKLSLVNGSASLAVREVGNHP